MAVNHDDQPENLLLAALRPPAAALVREYFDTSGPFAASTFETIGRILPDIIREEDLLAVSLLGVTYPPPAIRALLGASAAHITCLLEKVPDGVDLWAATDEDLAAADSVWHELQGEELVSTRRGPRWRRTNDAFKGVNDVKAGKLLARKRPRLIPVIDSVVVKAIGAEPSSYWQTYQRFLQEPENREAVERLRGAVDGAVSTLRLLDVAVWMRYSDGRFARAAQKRHGLEPTPRRKTWTSDGGV